MTEKASIFQYDLKLLTSLGGITGVITFFGLLAGICGYLVVRSHINYLGLEGMLETSVDDYIQEGGKYLFFIFLLSFFWFLPLNALVSLLDRKKLPLKGLLATIALITYFFLLHPLLTQQYNIVFSRNAVCTEAYNLSYTQAAIWFFSLRVVCVVTFFVLLLRYYRSQGPDGSWFFYTAVIFLIVIFFLQAIIYGQQVYHRTFPVVDNDLTFSENLREKVPQNDMLLLHVTTEEVLLFHCSERKVYYIAKSSIEHMAFSGEKRIFSLNE